MKPLRICLFLFVAIGLAYAQGDAPVVATLSAQASSCQPSTNLTACVFLAIPKTINSASITLAGTFSGTFQFEVSGDSGATWQSVQGTPSAGGSAVTSATAANTWQVNVAGYSFLRVRCSSYSSGSATATLNPSEAVILSSGGGSSGVSSLTGDGSSNTGIFCNSGSTGSVTLSKCSTFNLPSGAELNGTAFGPGATAASVPLKQFVTTTFSQTFSSSFLAANVVGLSWSLAANTNYLLECRFIYADTAGTSAPNFALTGPASPTLVSVSVAGNNSTGTTVTTAVSQSAASFPTQFGPSSGAGAVGGWTNFSAIIENGSNSGTLQVQAGALGTGTLTITAFTSGCVLY
jgi:hypothetical protein